MMQGELFKRYIWLIELIFRNDGITRDEINRQWRLSHLNNDKEKELPERTFHRHRKAIEEMFDITIICDRHGEKSYHIANKEDLKEGGAMEWLLNAFAVNNILAECKDMKHRILLEPVPTGRQFNDECKGRGYCHRVIFAGVKTPYRDSNGDRIYTGDVLDLSGEYSYGIYALGTLGENDMKGKAKYAFVLDNHCITPEMCKTMTRVGTVFYQLDWNDEPKTIAELCYRFQPWCPDGVEEKDRILMAKYTPNFDKEIWKYQAGEIFGIEFNWRKSP